jgi:prepilin-type processing-associated H-X9-DG protein
MKSMREPLRAVEVIVVGACLCLGVSLLAPCVLAAREGARETQCADHLRKLGSAFQKFESAQRGFPPRRAGFNDGHPYGGWGGFVLPHLEEPAVPQAYDLRYDFFDPKNKAIVETQLPTMRCPASPAGRFLEVQSQASTKSLNPDKNTVFSCKAATADFISSNGVLMARNGYGINALPGEQRIGNQRQPMTDNVNLPLSKITDGLSNTLLLIEQAGRPAVWRNRIEKKGDGQFGMSPNARGAWAGWGSIAFGAANAETGETPGRGDSSDCSVNCNNWFGIYGFHQGGASVLFCDGSVRFVSERLDPLTFAYLTIRDDGHIINQGDF